MTRRIVIHAGFHKTGTTTVQRMLHANGEVLWPVTALALRWRLKPVLAAALAYSDWRDSDSLDLFAARFDEFLTDLNLGAKRMLCLSSEELAGHMPGREGVEDYSATPALMATLLEGLRRRIPEADPVFYFSTRAPDSWLESAWAEHVKSSRMTLERDVFSDRYASAAEFGPIVEAVAEAVAPCPVVHRDLAQVTTLPLGPAEPLIDLLNLSPSRRIALTPQPRENAALPAEALAACLAINQSRRSYDEVRAAKNDILAPYMRQQKSRMGQEP